MTTTISSNSSTNVYQCQWCERISDKKLRKCGTCFSARYCDQRCQIAHWPEHKKVCPSPNTSTTDVTKSVASNTLLHHAQAEQTTAPFNPLNNTLTAPPSSIAEPKKEPSLPPSSDTLANQPTEEIVVNLGDTALIKKESRLLRYACNLFKSGKYEEACTCIMTKTVHPYTRIGFLKAYTKYICSLDKKNITHIMEMLPYIIPPQAQFQDLKKPFPTEGRETVIETLIKAKIFASREEIEKALEASSSVPNKDSSS